MGVGSGAETGARKATRTAFQKGATLDVESALLSVWGCQASAQVLEAWWGWRLEGWLTLLMAPMKEWPWEKGSGEGKGGEWAPCLA